MSHLPIIFIHGLWGGEFEYLPIIHFLRKHNYETFYKFSYRSLRPLAEIAGELEQFIEMLPEQKFILIGLSQGGIIARIYASRHPTRVNKCITVCSPHNGSYTSYFLPIKGIKDLRPGSDLLKKLNNTHTTFFSVYNPLDLIVFPGTYAKSSLAKKNKKVYALLHPFAFWSKKTHNFILECFEN